MDVKERHDEVSAVLGSEAVGRDDVAHGCVEVLVGERNTFWSTGGTAGVKDESYILILWLANLVLPANFAAVSSDERDTADSAVVENDLNNFDSTDLLCCFNSWVTCLEHALGQQEKLRLGVLQVELDFTLRIVGVQRCGDQSLGTSSQESEGEFDTVHER